MTAAAVIVAAGRGERFSLPAKCLVPLAGRPLLAYSVDAFMAAPGVAEVVLVVGSHTWDDATTWLASRDWSKPIRLVLGGAQRADSVRAGLDAVAAGADVVVVHDAARPLVTVDLIERTVAAAESAGAAIAACPVTDTIKRVAAGRIAATVPRDDLWAAQTPQAFRRNRLVAAFVSPVAKVGAFTDEAALFEALGEAVAVVPGEPDNIKVTLPGDLRVAEALLAARTAAYDNITQTHAPATTPSGAGR